ncbi:heme lyase CcmF/NrfE family subunit [Candidatus Bandiella euplotis]|uniref:heme lyase CcmF/NrfE family subunit n=1 Tax=Candidatus Bandiella euplotis TaxID=1664265 RepID=UPI002B2604A3|nr:heme lyase CcmF/NrfE family subunit [Candidatus Bandiella woodruffii]
MTLWLIVLTAVAFSFCSLIICHITSDFSVLNVAYHSHKLKPLLYKIAGAWSNHEGSMLLWTLAICIPSAFYGIFCTSHGPNRNITLVIQALLAAGFVLFTIFTSNPFERMIPAPLNGLGMNPLLQDIGVSFHPPILYLGYVGFSLPFSASLAVLITKDTSDWAKSIKPWVMFAWSFLTAGIATGAWWAYRELGWGGFWFWDPVENASLMPWITSSALIHSLMIAGKSRTQLNWAILLSIITFTLVMLGAFIVRSGVITSVHSFAQDSKRGVLILLSIFFITAISLFLYMLNFKKLVVKELHSNKLILLNNIILSIIAAVIALGTIYPIILEVFFKQSVSTSVEYYNAVVPPLVIGLVFLCTYAEKERKFNFGRLTIGSLVVSFIGSTLLIGVSTRSYTYAVFGVVVSLYLILITLIKWMRTRNFSKLPMLLAHCGFGFLVLSVSLYYNLREELQVNINIQETVSFRNTPITLRDIQYRTMENYFTKTAVIEVGNGAKVYPEIRFFPIEQQQTAEVGIIRNFFYDLYFSINSPNNSQSVILNVQFNPMVNLIWISCLLIFLAGVCSIVKKRVISRVF